MSMTNIEKLAEFFLNDNDFRNNNINFNVYIEI